MCDLVRVKWSDSQHSEIQNRIVCLFLQPFTFDCGVTLAGRWRVTDLHSFSTSLWKTMLPLRRKTQQCTFIYVFFLKAEMDANVWELKHLKLTWQARVHHFLKPFVEAKLEGSNLSRQVTAVPTQLKKVKLFFQRREGLKQNINQFQIYTSKDVFVIMSLQSAASRGLIIGKQ